VTLPTKDDVFISMVNVCGRAALVSAAQKVLAFPSMALRHSLPVWKLSQLTVHDVRSIDPDVAAATEGLAGIRVRGIPSNVGTPLTLVTALRNKPRASRSPLSAKA